MPVALVVAILAATGWASHVVGTVVSTCLAVAVLGYAPIAFAWRPRTQAVAAGLGMASHAWVVRAGALSTWDTFGSIFGLAVAAAFSLLGATHLEAQRDSDRAKRQQALELLQQALDALGGRLGLRTGGCEPEGSGSEPQVDPAVARMLTTIARIGAAVEHRTDEQAAEAMRERGMNAAFIGQAAHEFRTPLAVIQTATDALKLFNGRMSSHAQQERLAAIEECVEEMTTLLHNALTFSRVDAGRLKCERQPVDVRKLAQEVVESVQASFAGREIVLDVRGAARLPHLDPSLTREILSNLVTNAIKYSPDGDRVDVDVHVLATEVRLRVVDRGIGIAPEDQAYVFDAFRRGENVGDIAGTGLGLAITKRAVELHGGHVTVQSEPGRGTTFTATLPEGVKAAATRAA
jgi:signal transduction histidine kinase